MKTVGQFLKELRHHNGVSQRDLADKLGYSTPQFVSNWERGISFPPVSALKKIARIVGPTDRMTEEQVAEAMLELIIAETVSEITISMTKKFKGR